MDNYKQKTLNRTKEILTKNKISLLDTFVLSFYTKLFKEDLSDQIINKCSTVVYNAYKNQISIKK